ncbi:DUF4390 domain-containing protein [Thiohalobacter sp. IOR34]|uniref:DUF4390 domain-containing protein n=1 Tax=Thiohalobacter sp. IOR34 TaxID=3057176 RepID=UPI0025B0789B|nr:DUF4390 domain-containing protein [Thiohalobacter sp. IOR34]WJW75624.1 DUF4390 domain-containing protein [Thiohalobacter sp. IOR34]
MRYAATTGTGRGAGWLGGWLLLLWLLAPPLPAAEAVPRFQVRDLNTELRDGVYRLDANIVFPLSAPVKEALENGVPLVFELQMEVIRPRDWLWDETLAALSLRYRLRYHALSERYVLENLSTGVRQSYPSLNEALYRLGTLRDFPLLDRQLLPSGGTFLARLRAVLDIEALPTPLRVMAYVSRAWWLGSDWYQWQLEP